MYIEEYLSTNQKTAVDVSGTNVYISKGERVQVTCRPSGHTYTLRRGDQIQLPDGLTFDKVEIINLGATGDIELVCLAGKFYPTIDGSQLAITAEINANAIGVDFNGRQPVELPSTQKVVAEISNLPATQSVHVENMPAHVEVQKVHVVEETAPNLSFVAHNTMTATGTITANSKRKELILHADDGNEGTIWLGGYENKGYPLRPAGGFVLSNGSAIDVLIPANSKLYISEVTA